MKQVKGEFRRRQWHFSVEVPQENGWVLDESLAVAALGAAFGGKNARVGALVEFLEAVRMEWALRGSRRSGWYSDVRANKDGAMWNGETWVDGPWSEDSQFSNSACYYEGCAAAVEQAEQATGLKGFCWHIQREASPDMRLGPTRGFDRFPPRYSDCPMQPDSASAN